MAVGAGSSGIRPILFDRAGGCVAAELRTDTTGALIALHDLPAIGIEKGRTVQRPALLESR